MSASTERYPQTSPTDPTVHTDAHGAHRTAPAYDPATGRMPAAPAPAGPAPAEGRAARARRAVSVRIAAVIGLVAFLLGAGAALLVGGLVGPGDPPSGTGGPGGAPGTSQSSTSTGTSSTGT